MGVELILINLLFSTLQSKAKIRITLCLPYFMHKGKNNNFYITKCSFTMEDYTKVAVQILVCSIIILDNFMLHVGRT